MRSIRQAAFVFLLSAASVFAQEQPLPVVIPKIPADEPHVALEVEPPRQSSEPALARAARANDYATFDALFRASPSEAYRPLHDLWTYSVTDPVGAFYGTETYERIAHTYPNFAEYIAPFHIVDSRDNVFYPSSETRAFLLARAEESVVADTALRPDGDPSPAPLEPLPAIIASVPPVVIRSEPRPWCHDPRHHRLATTTTRQGDCCW